MLERYSSPPIANGPTPRSDTNQPGQRSRVSPRSAASPITSVRNARCHPRDASSGPVVSASVGTTPSTALRRTWSSTRRSYAVSASTSAAPRRRQIVLPGSTSSSRTTCRAARSSSVAGGSSAGSSKSLHSSPATAGGTGGRSWVGAPGRIRGGRRPAATATRSRIQAPARAAAPTRIGIEKVASELVVAPITPEMSTAHHRVPDSPGIVSAAMRRISLALVVIVLSGCGLEFGGGHGATRQGRDIFGLWQGSVIVALLVGGLVWGLIVFAVLRYRRRNDDLPSQAQYFVKLEILYTVVPVIIVAVLFAFSYRTQNRADALSSNPPVTIHVKA